MTPWAVDQTVAATPPIKWYGAAYHDSVAYQMVNGTIMEIIVPLNAATTCVETARVQTTLDSSNSGNGTYVIAVASSYGVFGTSDLTAPSYNTAQSAQHTAAVANFGKGFYDVFTLTATGCTAALANQSIQLKVLRNKTTYTADTAVDNISLIGVRLEDAHN
jgi:hypothetical protein